MSHPFPAQAALRRVGAAGLFSRATPGEARFWGTTAADLGDAVYDADCRPRAGRPAVAISSTSWSPDEDFTTLVDALAAYDASALRSLPKLVVIVTGKGPLKAQFLAEVARRNFARVLAKTAWLPAADYAAVLAAADLGVCLHSSTSGLDLPMKVVDMFGARLPVAALRFDCVDELVKDGENGLLFDDAKSLNAVFEALLADVDANAQLADLKRGVRVQERWDAMWRRAVLPVVGRAFASAAKAP
jgi:beta-1,4-mannosyltransferase